MNIAKWLNDMQHLYNSLCDLNTDRMSDREFALAILDLMPQNSWRNFVSGLRTKVRESDTQGLSIASITFITAICDEYWYRHKDDYQATSHIFSARYEAQNRSTSPKHLCLTGTDFSATSTSPPI
jgi:hypothetical protein